MTERIGSISRIGLVLGALGAAVVFWPKGADAHERPFVRDANQYPIDFSLLVSWPGLAAIVVSAVAVLAARETERRLGTRIWDLAQQLRRGPVLAIAAVSLATVSTAVVVSVAAALGAKELEKHLSTWRWLNGPVLAVVVLLVAVGSAGALSAAAVLGARGLERRFSSRIWDLVQQFRHQPMLRGIGITEERLRRLYGYLPLVLAIHVAVSLLISGVQGQLLAPNVVMSTSLLSGLFGLAEVVIALALVYGIYTEYASLGLIGLVLGGLVLAPLLGFPPLVVLEHVEFVGIALFLYGVGRGPYSGDAVLGRQWYAPSFLVRHTLDALRWGIGGSMIILAFTEKLLNPTLAEAFLRQKINFNFGQAFGMSDQVFIACAGASELTLGFLLISGAMPRLVILMTLAPFSLTLPYLGFVELVEHIPFYAVLLILLVVPRSQSFSWADALKPSVQAQEVREKADELQLVTAGARRTKHNGSQN